MDQRTEKEVRQIAKEEAIKVGGDILKEMEQLKLSTVENEKILKRLERLLLGEIGTDESETLKAKANFAYLYAKRNTDANLVAKFMPIAEWFDDMNIPEKGCDESKFDTLGKMITAYSSMRWLAGLFGVVSISTLIGLGILVMNFIKLVRELG